MRTPRIRRPRLSYANVAATLALVLAASMGGAYAHGKVGSALIKNNAVKSRHIAFQQVKTGDIAKRAVVTNRIKAKAVTRGKLAPSARTRIIHYNGGPHDFGAALNMAIDLPGTDTTETIAESAWSVQLVRPGGNVYPIPGLGVDGSSTYRLYIFETAGHARLVITRASGTGENYASVHVTRTKPTGSANATAVRGAPRAEG